MLVAAVVVCICRSCLHYDPIHLLHNLQLTTPLLNCAGIQFNHDHYASNISMCVATVQYVEYGIVVDFLSGSEQKFINHY